MKLRHLGLPVRDVNRSLRFYVTYFGFEEASAHSYPDGTVFVHNADRFDLALHETTEEVAAPSGFLHFGFAMPSAAAVRALRAEMESDKVPVIEDVEEANLVSFKCLDPDGWRVEVYWEVP